VAPDCETLVPPCPCKNSTFGSDELMVQVAPAWLTAVPPEPCKNSTLGNDDETVTLGPETMTLVPPDPDSTLPFGIVASGCVSTKLALGLVAPL
jgi:hypothetical protein